MKRNKAFFMIFIIVVIIAAITFSVYKITEFYLFNLDGTIAQDLIL